MPTASLLTFLVFSLSLLFKLYHSRSVALANLALTSIAKSNHNYMHAQKRCVEYKKLFNGNGPIRYQILGKCIYLASGSSYGYLLKQTAPFPHVRVVHCLTMVHACGTSITMTSGECRTTCMDDSTDAFAFSLELIGLHLHHAFAFITP